MQQKYRAINKEIKVRENNTINFILFQPNILGYVQTLVSNEYFTQTRVKYLKRLIILQVFSSQERLLNQVLYRNSFYRLNKSVSLIYFKIISTYMIVVFKAQELRSNANRYKDEKHTKIFSISCYKDLLITKKIKHF